MKHLERAFTGNNNFFLYAVIVIVSLLAQVIATIPLVATIVIIYSSSTDNIFTTDPSQILKIVDSNIALATLMIPMAVSLAVSLLLIWVIHKRSFSEIVNGTKITRWKRVGFGFVIWSLLLGLVTTIQYIVSPEDFTFQFEITKFIPLLIISVLLIPLQTTFEEILFRGYLAQGVGSLTKNRWLALLIPAILFAVLHFANPEIKEYGFVIMAITYFSMALIWGLVAILDDGIELPIGMHAANNIFISLFTTQKGSAFETAAVFEVAKSNPYTELIILILSGSVALAIFYRKYNWTFTTLNKKIEKPTDSAMSIS